MITLLLTGSVQWDTLPAIFCGQKSKRGKEKRGIKERREEKKTEEGKKRKRK